MSRAELICFTNSGMRIVRIVTVSITMDSVQVQPESAPSSGVNSQWKNTMRPETAQYSGCISADPAAMMESQILSVTKRSTT